MLILPRTDQLSEMPAAAHSSASLVTGMTARLICASVIPHQCRRQRLVESPVENPVGSPVGIRLVGRLGSRRQRLVESPVGIRRVSRLGSRRQRLVESPVENLVESHLGIPH
jgi:hypothetical protein